MLFGSWRVMPDVASFYPMGQTDYGYSVCERHPPKQLHSTGKALLALPPGLDLACRPIVTFDMSHTPGQPRLFLLRPHK